MSGDTPALDVLVDWLCARVDGDWEHQYGIELRSLDNPGWSLRIDLVGSPLEGRGLERVEIERGESDWLYYWASAHEFRAVGGPRNLAELVRAFRDWVASAQP